MLKSKIPLGDTKSFSTFFLDYIQKKESLREFYSSFPSPDNFNNLLTKKSTFPAATRSVLKEVLIRQYTNVAQSDAVRRNIGSLADSKTYTITTGHQLNIFTGPLYFIYKIITVINACRVLKEKYSAYNFVPVYWMASEDHDFEEISYFRLNGNKYVWETDQKGAVGRFKTTGLEKILNNFPGDAGVFRDAYLNSANLSDAVRHYVNHFFGDEGLVVIDADDAKLKSVLKPVMRADIVDNKVNELVTATNDKLKKVGYEPQVFCRDINFFYLDGSTRARIEKQNDQYKVVDTDISFSQQELEDQIEKNPERFSPNVILRPLYQEMILPNLAYVGGPAEIVYWLQLKSVFDHFSVPFPALMPRNFAMVIDQPTKRKFDKTGLEIRTLFEPKNFIFNHWVLKNTSHNLTVGKERDAIISMYNDLKKRAESIDKTLEPFVGAESKRALNSLEKIEKKMLRAEKRLHSDRLRQIEAVKDILFPNGSLQERTDNFLNFYQQDPQFISKLIGLFDPFDFTFNVLTYPA
jgi:bacillithiol biosynthesis cysteine-adding enzyme BshC